MSRFAILNPYLTIVLCLVILVLGITSLTRMPVDLFPFINIPVVSVATFYSGMPPEQIEGDITTRYERFFTLGSGIDRMESRSLPGVSVIKIFFHPGTDQNAALTSISNLAMANLRRLPPGTMPPILLNSDASSMPVCLVTVTGKGHSETLLRDTAYYTIRNQLARIPGASVPQPFGGKVRQIMIYVDPLKLEAYQLSPMDVVRAVNNANLILPAGNVKIGPYDYGVNVNSQLSTIEEINELPLKTEGKASVRVKDIGMAKDAEQIQYNVVRVDGQNTVYIPILKQGGNTSTIEVVENTRKALENLVGLPEGVETDVVFDQSHYVKEAIKTLFQEGALGVFLTSVMILVFLGSLRATVAALISIPLSALATFVFLSLGNSSINTMVLAGLALVFSRVIDNSVVVIENIFRHMELGESPAVAAEKGAREVALPVLAATLTTMVVFFPVTLLYGVSQFLFSAMALAIVLSLFASYIFALTVVPLYCAHLIRHTPTANRLAGPLYTFLAWFNRRFRRLVDAFEHILNRALNRPAATIVALSALFVLSLPIYPFLGVSYFPRTDAGQFTLNLKAPSGTRLEVMQEEVRKVEDIIRDVIEPGELRRIVSNIGATQDISAIYTSNAASHTAFVQVSMQDDADVGTYEYMDRVRRRIASDLPYLTYYLYSGGMADAVLNLGLPAPIDIQVSGSDLKHNHDIAENIARQVRKLPGVSDVFIPQDLDAPRIEMRVNREQVSQLNLNAREVVSNIITSLVSNQMIAPTFWVDPKSNNDYFLTVQYPEGRVKNLSDLTTIPLRGQDSSRSTTLGAVTTFNHTRGPTEITHYQIHRVVDVYVNTAGEDLGKVAADIKQVIANIKMPKDVQVNVRGTVQEMRTSFRSFALGLMLSALLVYLILVAQFRSFLDPFLIILAVPMGLIGVLLIMLITGTTVNVQSLMGVLMLVGIATSNSILIIDFARRSIAEGMPVREALVKACRVRLRPIIMTSLATIIGLLPIAFFVGTGAEAYAPLARAIIGGLTASVVLTMFIVPAAYLLVYRNKPRKGNDSDAEAVP